MRTTRYLNGNKVYQIGSTTFVSLVHSWAEVKKESIRQEYETTQAGIALNINIALLLHFTTSHTAHQLFPFTY